MGWSILSYKYVVYLPKEIKKRTCSNLLLQLKFKICWSEVAVPNCLDHTQNFVEWAIAICWPFGFVTVLENGPAKSVGIANKIRSAGDTIADIFDISTVRREDLNFHRGQARGDDVLQSNNNPSSRTPRGHQSKRIVFLCFLLCLINNSDGEDLVFKRQITTLKFNQSFVFAYFFSYVVKVVVPKRYFLLHQY